MRGDAATALPARRGTSATMIGSFSLWSAAPLFALVCLGSVVLGAALSQVTLFLSGRIEDVATSVIVQFLSTFAVWIMAERLHLSGIITVVVYAIVIARTAPARMPARLPIPSYAVWEVAVFVLNVLAFILVGMQLRPILERLDRAQLVAYLDFAAVVCAVVVVVRLAPQRKLAERTLDRDISKDRDISNTAGDLGCTWNVALIGVIDRLLDRSYLR